MSNDLISREALRKAIETWDKFACLPNGELEPFRSLEHPEMFEPYVHVRDILHAIDNAPTVEPRIEYGSDGQPYRMFMSSGQVVPDMLQGWRYEERPQGEWKYAQYDANPNIGNWHCSGCGHIVFGGYSQKPYYNFCPNCGAKMNGGAE
jgi:hypothetical protein